MVEVRVIKTPIVPVVPKHDVQVHMILSPEAAVALRTFTRGIGGCPKSSLRKYADEIAGSLESAGVGYSSDELTGLGCHSIHYMHESLFNEQFVSAVKKLTD